MSVAIVATGVTNLASVIAPFVRLGVQPAIARDAASLESASHVLLPGNGSFGAAAAALARQRLVHPLRERARLGRPLLAICLGMQLLFDGSDESPDAPGLSIVSGRVRRFGDGVRVPKIGWDRVRPAAGCRLLQPGWAYFANSFRATAGPEPDACALSDHGGPFVAAFERGALLACQFHPELSGSWGAELLARWLATEDRR